MINNPIMDEIHQAREELLASFGGDLHAMIRDAHRRTDEAIAQQRQVAVRSPRPVQITAPNPRKVG